MNIQAILEAVQKGELDIQAAATQLQGFEDLGHSRVDTIRAERNGADEVIFGQGKATEHIIEIIGSLNARDQNILVTRVEQPTADAIIQAYPNANYNSLARLLSITNTERDPVHSKIAVVCAGTSDLPVAEEARLTAEFYGNPVEKVYDAGVAGLHRLLASMDTINSCKVVIVVAGMEGALPSVVGGLVKAPVIAVPTSVGYGANFGGLSALLGMLNSCASGLTVVNIDNGFGAGYAANRINRL
ncbi:MAG TPA: nickel pincer cofactor biosynthesis protein LarB [Opitutae bacterium]|nr:nickel pincer cofactor biosynthesis protein LarB [Opitutae bacterium]